MAKQTSRVPPRFALLVFLLGLFQALHSTRVVLVAEAFSSGGRGQCDLGIQRRRTTSRIQYLYLYHHSAASSRDDGAALSTTNASGKRNEEESNTTSRRCLLVHGFAVTATFFHVGNNNIALAVDKVDDDGSRATAAATTMSDPQEKGKTGAPLSRDRVAFLLRKVPTFTLVDAQGVPFMVVGQDAKVTGYFFTSYDEAQRILTLASRSAEQAIREESKADGQTTEADGTTPLSNPWKLARISTLPLDAAVSLALDSSGGRSTSMRNYFQVAPAAHDVEDALAVTGKDSLAEGKVPLFYYEDFTIAGGDSPIYFSKAHLEAAFRRQRGAGTPLPECKVTELFAVLTAMVTTTTNENNNNNNNNNDLQSVVFVPPPDSARRAKECQRRGKGQPPFVLGQRNLVL